MKGDAGELRTSLGCSKLGACRMMQGEIAEAGRISVCLGSRSWRSLNGEGGELGTMGASRESCRSMNGAGGDVDMIRHCIVSES